MRGILYASLMATALAASSVMAQAQAPGTPHKPVVSVDDISDMAQTGQGPVLQEMITTAVINTGKFRVMERGAQGTGVLLKEQAGAKSGLYTSKTPGKIGGFEGVDFKVYGTITTGGATTSRNTAASAGMSAAGAVAGSMFGGQFGSSVNRTFQANSNCTNSAASLAVDIRITDASTGEARYAKHITEVHRSGVQCGGSAAQVDLGDLLRSAAQSVSVGLVTMMYPVKVVDVDGSQVMFNYGEGLLAPGEVYALFSQGRQIIDPDNGAVIGNSEKFMALVRVTEVLPKMSKGQVILADVPPTVGAVAREASPEDMRRLSPGKRR